MRVLKDAAAREGRRVIIAVAGCVAQAEGEEIVRRARAVDLVVGPQSYHRLPADARARRHGTAQARRSTPNFRSRTSSAISRRRAARRRASAASPPSSPCRKAATSSAPSASCPTRAAPKSRGRSPRSSPRPSGSPTPACARSRCSARTSTPITARTKRPRLARSAGCCIVSPKSPASRACATPPAIRATWTTSLIAAHRDLPALMPYLHLPVQSGSDRVLAAMNRRHTRADYLARDRAPARGAARHRALLRFHRRLSGRDRGRFRDTLQLVVRGRLRQRLLVQVFAAARHAGGRHGTSCRKR